MLSRLSTVHVHNAPHFQAMFDAHRREGVAEAAADGGTRAQGSGEQDAATRAARVSDHDAGATAAQVQAQHLQAAPRAPEVGHEAGETGQEPNLPIR